MTDTNAPVEGRRRATADTITPRPIATEALERTTMTTARPFGNDFPEHAPHVDGERVLVRPMLEDAFDYATDRLDRLEHLLGSLNGTLMRAGTVLEPLLTGGSYDEPDAHPTSEGVEASPEDRRSTIAKRVVRLGLRADNLADATSYIERRLEAILDALEIG